jgi:hypothetical protein
LEEPDQEGEDYSSRENIQRRYYSRDCDLVNLEEKMNEAKHARETPQCEVAKDGIMMAACIVSITLLRTVFLPVWQPQPFTSFTPRYQVGARISTLKRRGVKWKRRRL